MSVRIIPAMLPVDYARLGEDCVALEKAGADRLQWDVMDGTYVPNITYGPDVIAACRPHVDVGFEVHIMCERPEELLPRYVEAGCELLIVHPETLRQPHHTYSEIRRLGARCGVAVTPSTPLAHVEHALDLLDLLLVMTVNPGFGGQSYISAMEPKIAAARRMIDASGFDIELEVDGGIGAETIRSASAAGATAFVSGSALWKYDSFAEGMEDLRARAVSGRRDATPVSSQHSMERHT